MTAYFEVEKYKQYLLKMQGGKQYLQVIGQLKGAIDYGVLLGVEQDVIDNPDVVRVKVRVKVLNKHLDGWESLPDDQKIGYYEGWADNPKKGGKGAAALFPLEDALTSALGRALTLVGFNYNTTATADEMEIVTKKAASGYLTNDEVFAELKAKLKAAGITTNVAAEKAAKEKFGKALTDITAEEARQWCTTLSAKPSVPF